MVKVMAKGLILSISKMLILFSKDGVRENQWDDGLMEIEASGHKLGMAC